MNRLRMYRRVNGYPLRMLVSWLGETAGETLVPTPRPLDRYPWKVVKV